MITVKELKETRGELIRSIKAIADEVERSEKQEFTTEQAGQYDKLLADKETLDNQISNQERLERSRSLETATAHKPNTPRPEDADLCFRAWALRASSNAELISPEMQRAVDRNNFDLNKSYITRSADGQSSTAAAGGYTITGSVFSGIDVALKAYGGLRGWAKVIRTATAGPINFATNDNTSATGSIVAQNVQTTADDLVFGTKALGSFTYRSGAFPVSLELLQDSGMDLGSYIGEALGERLARATNSAYAVGAGTTAPFGLFVEAGSSGVTTASATAITFAELLAVYHSVDPAYRNDPSCAWVMNDTTLALLEGLVDDNGRPLLMGYDGYVNGGLAKIMGKPVVIVQEAPAPTAALKPIAFGALNRFVIRDVADTSVKVLQERYADYNAIGFVAMMRTDSKLLNTSAVKRILMHA